MRPAIFSTENPPVVITCVETLEYINGLRRRIEIQNDQMEHLVAKNTHLVNEIEKLSLDLGIERGDGGPGWQEVKP